ncbi:MAG: hypothetical protein ABW328_21645 [Ilumatobacteraceae bacterium]
MTAPVDPVTAPPAGMPDLDAIAADLAGVEAALAALDDGTYLHGEPTAAASLPAVDESLERS